MQYKKRNKHEEYEQDINKNLNNLGERKTRTTVQYIDNLEPLQSWTPNQINNFNRLIEKAKTYTTANEMLASIGYRFRDRPSMYDRITGMK